MNDFIAPTDSAGKPVPVGEAKIDKITDAVETTSDMLIAISSALGIGVLGAAGYGMKKGATAIKNMRKGQTISE